MRKEAERVLACVDFFKLDFVAFVAIEEGLETLETARATIKKMPEDRKLGTWEVYSTE